MAAIALLLCLAATATAAIPTLACERLFDCRVIAARCGGERGNHRRRRAMSAEQAGANRGLMPA